MMNYPNLEKEAVFLVCVKLVVLGRPPWITRRFRDVGMWLSSLVYAAGFSLYIFSSAMKIRLEYRLCDMNNIHFITLAHDIFNTFFICFFVFYSYMKQPDQCVEFCAHFRILEARMLCRSALLFVPATSVLLINVLWQTTVFSTALDLTEAIAYHAFSILVWNGLWVFVCVRIYTDYAELRKLSIEAKLRRVETLNDEIGLYLLLLFAKSVFDAISSLTFYSIQKSPLPQLLLFHETGVIFHDLLFCAAISELSSRLSRDIRRDFLREAPCMTKVSGSMPWTTSLQTALLPQGLDAFGVFTVNRSFFATMCGTTLTFLLILVQLSPDVQRIIRVDHKASL